MLQSEARRYRVLEAIGKGGFGTVYKAELLGSGGFVKTVALKVLNDNVANLQGTSERLRDEARMLGLLRHRAIVQVDGFLQLNGRWAVVMEYIEGVDLKQLLTAGPVPVGVALEIVQEVANALYVAYERPSASGEPLRLIHRDLKPSNIHLTPTGGVKVLDFGVARAEFAAREAITEAIAFGSIGYMAPERFHNVNSHAADVYALAAILYELLLAVPLGRTDGQSEGHDALLGEGLDRLWQACPNEELYHLIAECLSFAPESRPPARELERRLRGLRMQFPEPWLSDWAEGVVPGVAAALERQGDEIVGSVLSEDSTPRNTLSPELAEPTDDDGSLPGEAEVDDDAERSTPPRAWVLALTGLVSATLVAGVGGSALFWIWSRRSTDADPVVEVEQAGGSAVSTPPAEDPAPEAPAVVEPAVEPAVEPTVEPTVEPVIAADPPPEVEPPPPVAAPTQADPAPAPPKPKAYGNIIISGYIPDLRLIRGGKTYTQGKAPVGTYTVRANVDGVDTELARFTLSANQTVTLTCKVRFKSCVVL